MPRTEPRFETGSYLEHLRALWAPLYRERIALLGVTTTICPMGDPYYGKLDAATFASQYGASGLAATWTPTSALASLATPFKIPEEIQGHCPVITPNGTSEAITTPDDTYWTRGNGTTDSAFSIVFWYRPKGTANIRILGKYATAATGEWLVRTGNSNALLLFLRDASAGVECYRAISSAPASNVWHHAVATYDATGGATAANGIIWYVDGASVTSAATNDANYVAMEDLTSVMEVFRTAASYANMPLAGGPLGFAFIQAVLTADTIRQDYDLCRAFLPY